MNNVAVIEQQDNEGSAPRSLSHLKIGNGVSAIVPQTFDDVFRFARLLAGSGLTPKDMNTPEKCAVALLHGMELGLKPMQAIQSICVMNGRPTIWGDVAMAMIRASGELEDFSEEYSGTPYEDDYTAHCTIKRCGQKPVTRSFSVKQAKTAKLWNKKGYNGGDTPWVTYPDRMMMRRARGMAQTDSFQDILKGMQIAEDVQDALGIEPAIADIPATPPIPPAPALAAPQAVPTPPEPPAPPVIPEPPTPPVAAVATRAPDPEAIIAEFRDAMDAAEDAASIAEAWDDIVSAFLGDLFPPDVAVLEKMRDDKIRRL